MTDYIGSLIVDLKGQELTSDECEIIAHPVVGGVILFSRNYAAPAQLSNLCKKIKEIKSSPLLIMVDQEGGRVQRFIKDFTRLPRMAIFGQEYDKNPTLACDLAKDCGWLMACELLAFGIDLSLAPVLDLNKGISTVIGERAFHADPKAVIALTSAFIEGMRLAGMSATGKHFPGHGSVSADSHTAIPIDERSYTEIEQQDLIPFAQLIKVGIKALMAAHIIFPQVDNLPVSYSSEWLQTILRKKLNFSGAIFSDDLSMEGANISTNYADRVTAAREAGCDFTLVCNNPAGVVQVLDEVKPAQHQVAKTQWLPLLGKMQNKAYQENLRWQQTKEFLTQWTENV